MMKGKNSNASLSESLFAWHKHRHHSAISYPSSFSVIQRLRVLSCFLDNTLASDLIRDTGRTSRQRILLLSPYIFLNRSQGGAIRTNNICTALLNHYDLLTVEFTNKLRPSTPYSLLRPQSNWIHVSCAHLAPLPTLAGPALDFHYSGYITPEMTAILSALVKTFRPDLLWAEFSYMGVYSWIARLHQIPFLLSMHNIEWMILKELQVNQSLERRSIHGDWRVMRQVEDSIIKQSPHIIVTTKHDKTRVQATNRKACVHVAPNIISRCVPSLDPSNAKNSSSNDDLLSLAFVGDCSYLPNSLGVQWFYEQIYCDLESHYRRSLRVSFYGKNSDRLRPRKAFPDHLNYMGYASDLDDVYHQADAVLIPLLQGGGSRLKAFEAIRYAKPVVSTPKGVEGIPLEGLEDFIYLFDSVHSFIASISRLKANLRLPGYLPDLRKSYSEAYSHWISQFDAAILGSASSSISNHRQ